jgi:hypothetical protein
MGERWDYCQTAIRDSVIKYSLYTAGVALNFSEFLSQLKTDPTFQLWFSRLLVSCEFEAFRWECPAFTRASLPADAEFVLVHARSFATRRANGSAFEAFFNDKNANAFPNLSGDAIMVVPSPKTDTKIYGHLASFVRHAPSDQIQDLWGLVADETLKKISEKPIWLNTAGGGVPWLHIRLDKRPKYYHHQPYKSLAQ